MKGTHIMRSVSIEPLSDGAFRPFGQFRSLVNPEGTCIGETPIEFYRDMLQQEMGGAAPSYSVCRVAPRPFVIDTMEYHSTVGEASMPLDGDILIHVAPATPNGELPLDAVRVFHVPRGTMVVLRPGVWHHAPYALRDQPAHVLVVLPERSYANDCKCFTLEKSQKISINMENDKE